MLAAAASLDERSPLAQHVVRRGRGELDDVARLVGRPVVAGEPRRRAVRLAATITPSASSSQPASPSGPPTGRGMTAVHDRHRELVARPRPAAAGGSPAGRCDGCTSPGGPRRRVTFVTDSRLRSRTQALGVPGHPAAQVGPAGEAVVLDAVAAAPASYRQDVEARGHRARARTRRPVRPRAGSRRCRPDGRLSASTQGPIGLPIQRVLPGTDSPRITSDTGPDRGVLAEHGRGQDHAVRPERRAGPQASRCPCSSSDHGTGASARRTPG